MTICVKAGSKWARPLCLSRHPGGSRQAAPGPIDYHGGMKPDQFHFRLPGVGVMALCACLAGCTTTPKSAPPADPPEEIPILDSTSGSYSRLKSPVRIVIRDAATLARLPLAEVDVDFDTQMILLAGLGPTYQEGTGIRITRVWREGSRIRVQERTISGGMTQVGQPQRVSPWTMVIVPRHGMNVEGYSTQVPARALAGP